MNQINIDKKFIVTESEKYMYNDEYFVPRVNEILSNMIHEDGLMSWANYMGLCGSNYKNIINRATDTGTKVHYYIENILNNNNLNYDNESVDVKYGIESFKKWYNIVESSGNNIRTLFTEKELVGKYFGGTVDWIVSINNTNYIVDFKTSKNLSYKYVLQLAAYRLLIKEILNINIDNFVLLRLSKTNVVDYEEIVINDINIIKEAEITFIKLLEAYFYLINTKMKLRGEYNFVY